MASGPEALEAYNAGRALVASPEVLFEFSLLLDDPEPPSVNKMYTVFRNRKILTKTGRAFKAALIEAVTAETMVLPWAQAVDAVYKERAQVHLYINFYTMLYNASWKPGARTPSGELQSPYKKEDAPNYEKAISDAISEATGIDDSAHIITKMTKCNGSKKAVEVLYQIVRG